MHKFGQTVGTQTGSAENEPEAQQMPTISSRELDEFFLSKNETVDTGYSESFIGDNDEMEMEIEWEKALIDLESNIDPLEGYDVDYEMDTFGECSQDDEDELLGAARNPLVDISDMNPEEPTTNDEPMVTGVGRVRDYQLAICEMAVNRNIIACLPTGSGKTLIAIKLMNSFREQVSKGKRIFFVAPTIPLVKQQAEAIKNCTKYTVQTVCSDNKNQWKDWKNTIKFYEVFVIVPALLAHILNHAFITMKDMALLIIDECHHALKAHALNLVMRKYKSMYDQGISDIPRVLGLTATIVKQNLNDKTVEDVIKQVEHRLCCTAVTYDKQDEVLKHSTSAELKIESFETTNAEKVVEFMSRLKGPMDLYQQLIGGLGASTSPGDLLEQSNEIKKMKDEYRGKINCITDIEEVYSEIGAFGAMTICKIRYQYFKDLGVHFIPKHWQDYFMTGLVTTMFNAYNAVIPLELEDEFLQTLSPKMMKLLKILESYRSCPELLSGIIFVKRRTDSHAVGAVLDHLRSKFSEKWGYIKPAVVVGTNRLNTDPPTYRQTERRQGEILDEFRAGLVNLVVSTAILEEGIDVRSCSLIVRFDRITTYPSFIQSMGRARRQGAQFFVLVSSKELPEAQTAISRYTDIKHDINSSVMTQADSVKLPLLPNLEERQKKDIDDLGIEFLETLSFQPGDNPEGPVITMFSSIQIVNTYCGLLPKDIIYTPADENNKFKDIRNALSIERRIEGDCRAFDTENDFFQGLVRLPINAVVKGVISGPVIRGRENAKRAAYLEVCKKLYQAGVLDDNLLPNRAKMLH